jgi:pSer/pThr/pTyr-binding forkhead associated (FHA) protein
MIVRTGQNLTLVDRERQRTFINGHASEHLLKDGDLFVIGKYTLQFNHQVRPRYPSSTRQEISNTVLLRAPSELARHPKMDSAVHWRTQARNRS